MKEIEILVEVYDEVEKVKDKLKNFSYEGTKKVVDEYYYDPLRNNLKPDEQGQIYQCLRLRQKNNDYFITYKDDVFEGSKWLYSNEYETKVENINTIKKIFENLGLVKFIEINNEKEIYKYNNYEIALEKVSNLGNFLEVEYCTNDDVDVKQVKKEIQEFIDNLGIKVSNELNIGKPEMYLKKNNVKI